ncbi:MAG: formimidoylglutamate deiminase [Acidimicrobiia bacterium]
MTRRIWCEYAWLGGERPTASVLLEITEGRFTAVTVDATAGDAQRRPGVSFPGFANGHSHAFHRALRGRTHDRPGSFWTWREAMYRLAARLDPNAYFRLARATFSEMVSAGYTTVGEFHYLHHGPAGRPYEDPNEMGRTVIAAARDAGLRITLLDTCYLHGGFDRPLDVVQRRFGDGDVDAWASRVAALNDAEGVRIGAAVHSVRACTPEEIAAIAAHSTDRPLHAHVSEQPAENEGAVARYGRTPTTILSDAGALGENFTAVHATHLTDADIGLLATSTVCACPSTERDLADGVGPFRRLLDAGARLTVGSDSNTVVDAFDEGRSLDLHERLVSGERGRLSVGEILGALTDHGSLGWHDAGTIAVGARADLVTVGLGSMRLAGSDPTSVLWTIVSAATPADITHVTIDGVDRVSDGAYLAGDVVAEFDALIPRLFA